MVVNLMWYSSALRSSQGSVLGPLQFIMYINDVSDILSNELKVFWISIQMICYFTNQSTGDFKTLQSDIDEISHWLSIDFPTLTRSKARPWRSRGRGNHVFQLNSSWIAFIGASQDIQYLGVLISSDLTWSVHIDSICATARELIGQP